MTNPRQQLLTLIASSRAAIAAGRRDAALALLSRALGLANRIDWRVRGRVLAAMSYVRRMATDMAMAAAASAIVLAKRGELGCRNRAAIGTASVRCDHVTSDAPQSCAAAGDDVSAIVRIVQEASAPALGLLATLRSAIVRIATRFGSIAALAAESIRSRFRRVVRA